MLPRLPALTLTLALTPQLQAQTLSFSDQTDAAGLFHTHTCPELNSGLCEMTGGGAAFDVDRDGWPDLFALGGGFRPDRLFINRGDGRFRERSTEFGVDAVHVGSGAAAGDVDADGWLDMYVTSLGPVDAIAPGHHRLLMNNSGKSFTDGARAAGVETTSPLVADGFSPAFGDYDLDGDLDLCVAGWVNKPVPSGGNRLFRNDGDGSFTDVTGLAISFPDVTYGFTPTFADMDGDLHPELLFAADFGTSVYFVNDGAGGFVDVTADSGTGLDANGMGSAVADLNGDGRLDWYVTSIYDPDSHVGFVGDGNKLYVNEGDHSYAEVSVAAGVDDGAFGWGTVAVDLDHDGWTDLVETNGFFLLGFVHPSFVWLNNGDLSFTEVAAATGFDHLDDGKGLAHFDYDLDGDQDFVVFSNRGELRLFRNDLQGPDAHWLRVTLDTGSVPGVAPDGFGTWLVARSGGRTLHRYLDGGSRYLATSELAVHFGLGSAESIDELEVTWPDGVVSLFHDLPVDRNVRIVR